MTRILLSGCCGHMGGVITECAAQNPEYEIVCGVDPMQGERPYPVFSSFDEVDRPVDVIIDFSHVSCLDGLLAFATKKGLPTVIATTGFSADQQQQIRTASAKTPIFYTGNFSLGINLLCALAKKTASVLGSDFDVEIVEKHHNQKIDAPSGTALMLANAVNSVFNDGYAFEYDRHSKRQKRPKKEIGIHSLRGGTIVGEHEVLFAGRDEVITLSHAAASKSVFAVGSLRAAAFLNGKTPGLYDMNDMLSFLG